MYHDTAAPTSIMAGSTSGGRWKNKNEKAREPHMNAVVRSFMLNEIPLPVE